MLDFGIGRARPLLESARQGVRVNCLLVAALARARERLGRRFRSAAPARSYGSAGGDCSARADRKRWPRGGCGVCALWHFRLGDRALDPWACGRRTARGQSWSPVLADSEARRCFLFGTWRSAVAELFGNSRSQQLAAGQPSDALALCWILALAERDRSLNLLGKGSALTVCWSPPSRARGIAGRRFRSAAPARSYGVCSAAPARSYGDCWREPIENAGRGVAVACVRSGISGWVIGLLIRGRAGAEQRAANPGRRCWPTARLAAVFCLGLGDRRWRSSSATAARNSWPQGSLRMCSHCVGFWHWPSATAP